VAVEEMTKLGESTGMFTITHSEDLAALSAENLKNFQVVFFCNTTGNWKLTPEQRDEFIGWVQAGGAFVGAHAATDTGYDWPEYGALTGGYFDGHPWHELVGVVVEKPDHPAAEGFAERFSFLDEIYQHRNWSRDKVEVVMRLDIGATDMTKPGIKRTDGDFGLVWGHAFGEGRSVYSAFGHRDETWRNPLMQRHFLGCLKWAAKLDWQSDPAIGALLQNQDAAGLVALARDYPAALQAEPVKAVASIDTAAAAGELATLIADGAAPYRLAALRAYGGMTAGGLEPLLAALKSASPEVRVATLEALGQRGGQAAEAAALAAFDDPVAEVRDAAMQAAGRLGTATARARLLDILTGQPELAAKALQVLAVDDPGTLQALAGLLADPRPEVRGLWPEIIRKLAGRYDQEAVFAGLQQVVEQAGPALDPALLAIAKSGRPEAAAKIEAWIFDSRGQVASAAARASATLDVVSDRLTGFSKSWRVLGGFASADGLAAHDTVLPPEETLDWQAKYQGAAGEIGWRTVDAPNGRLDLRRVLKPTDNAVGYAATVIQAPRAMEAELRLGSDDGAKAWLNGQEVLNKKTHRGLGIDQDRVKVTLRDGANTLLVKVGQGGGDWLLMVRLSRAEGGLTGVEFKLPE
jgi:type 1 glutamine amidotransferase